MTKKFGNFPRTISIAVGAKVMAQRNICTPNGLTNGSCWEIIDILRDAKNRPKLSDIKNLYRLPDVILAKMGDGEYVGKSCLQHEPWKLDNVAPLIPICHRKISPIITGGLSTPWKYDMLLLLTKSRASNATAFARLI